METLSFYPDSLVGFASADAVETAGNARILEVGVHSMHSEKHELSMVFTSGKFPWKRTGWDVPLLYYESANKKAGACDCIEWGQAVTVTGVKGIIDKDTGAVEKEATNGNRGKNEHSITREPMLTGKVERIHLMASERSSSPVTMIFRYRSELRKYVRERVAKLSIALTGNRIHSSSGDAEVLMLALLLGHRTDRDAPIYESMRNSGCTHLLALSGMHLHIIAVIAQKLLSFMIFRRKLIRIAVLVFCVLFTCIAGLSPSLVRACLLLCLMQLSRISGNVKGGFELLQLASWTLIFQSILFPGMVEELGFLLSNTAVYGVLLLANRFSLLLPGIIPRYIRDLSGASFAAVLVTSPILICFFQEIYPAGVIAALPLSFLIILFMIVGFLLLVPVLGDMTALTRVAENMFKLIDSISGFFSSIPPLRVETGSVKNTVVIMLIVLVFILTASGAIEYAVFKRTSKD